MKITWKQEALLGAKYTTTIQEEDDDNKNKKKYLKGNLILFKKVMKNILIMRGSNVSGCNIEFETKPPVVTIIRRVNYLWIDRP